MIGKDFHKFYQSYFLNDDFTVTPVDQASIEQANRCEILNKFNWELVEDLPLVDLFKTQVSNIPKNTVFLGPGKESDPIHRYALQMFNTCGRSDISIIEADGNITRDFLKFSSEKYFCFTPWHNYALFNMQKLVEQGITTGVLGFFPMMSMIENRWVVSEAPHTLPFYMFSKDWPNLVIPNLVLPLARAFIKEVLADPTPKDSYGTGDLIWRILKSLGLDLSGFSNIYFDTDQWNRHPYLVNRNWASPTYHTLKHF